MRRWKNALVVMLAVAWGSAMRPVTAAAAEPPAPEVAQLQEQIAALMSSQAELEAEVLRLQRSQQELSTSLGLAWQMLALEKNYTLQLYAVLIANALPLPPLPEPPAALLP